VNYLRNLWTLPLSLRFRSGGKTILPSHTHHPRFEYRRKKLFHRNLCSIFASVAGEQMIADSVREYIAQAVACREGVERGAGPGIQRVKLQKLKCCNEMVFHIVSLLTHAAWI